MKLTVSKLIGVWALVIILEFVLTYHAPDMHAQAAGQPAPQGGMLAEQAFKNVQALKGISVDDFMGTMGIMCASLGFDCADCHDEAGTEKVDWAADTPKKVRARGMVRMMRAINRDSFSGRQVVTCWTCHHGRDRPSTTPTMEH